MLEMFVLALDNNFIFIGIIAVLIVVIILTVLSIKKDRDQIVKNRKIKEVEQPIEPAETKEEQERARLELEKVVNTMKTDLENKSIKSEIVTYEQEQEEKAIISYQELVEAVKKNNATHKPQTEIGMEVASEEAIEAPTSVEEKLYNEELDHKADEIIQMLNSLESKQEIKEEIKQEEEIKTEEVEPKVEKKFQTSAFISPVYGTNPQPDIRKEEQQTNDEPSLDEVIKDDLSNTEEFLDSLKDFRNNL